MAGALELFIRAVSVWIIWIVEVETSWADWGAFGWKWKSVTEGRGMIVKATEVGSGAEIGAVSGTSVEDPLASKLAGRTHCIAGGLRRS